MIFYFILKLEFDKLFILPTFLLIIKYSVGDMSNYNQTEKEKNLVVMMVILYLKVNI